MRNLLFSTILFLLFAVSAHSQCPPYQCTSSYYLPIYDPSDVNNDIGDKCFINAADTAAWMLHPEIGFGQWATMGFYATGSIGAILAMQPIDIKRGRSVYVSSGTVRFSSCNMSSDGGPSRLYLDHAILYIDDMTNIIDTNNIVFIGTQSQIFIDNIEYFAGDTLKIDNENYIAFESCQPIVMAENILKYRVYDNIFSWVIVDDATITISKLVGAKWEDVHSSDKSHGSFVVTESGYYMATSGSSRTAIHKIVIDDNGKIRNILSGNTYDVMGRIVEGGLQLHTPYFKEGKSFIIIK